MAKTGKRAKIPPYIALPWAMVNSPAYFELSHPARSALTYFIGRVCATYKIHIGNGQVYAREFSVSYTEAAKKVRLTPKVYRRALAQLYAHGFIDLVSRGGCNYGTGQEMTVLRLSQRWKGYNVNGFVHLRWDGVEP